MAEANRTGILAKAQKRLSRTKTKVLQTFGKADKSTDESFDELVQKTEKQQEVAQHLQKEIKTYLHCVRALGQASKSLATAVSQTYEEEWTDAAEVKKSLESVDLLWTDYQQNVHEKVLDVLNDYIASFPSLKARIAKRGRKMVDYDNSRHNLAVLQTAKKTDEVKITKAQEDLNESKRIYEELHKELCADLPDFYNSRITFYADIFQKLFGQESILHCELATISDTVNTINEKLATEFLHFAYKPRRPLSQSVSDNSEEQELNGESSPKHQPLSASAIQSTPSRQQDTVSKGHFYSNEDEAKSPVRINGSIDNKEEGQQRISPTLLACKPTAAPLDSTTCSLPVSVAPPLVSSIKSVKKKPPLPPPTHSTYANVSLAQPLPSHDASLAQPLSSQHITQCEQSPPVPYANPAQEMATLKSEQVSERTEGADNRTSSAAGDGTFVLSTHQEEVDQALSEVVQPSPPGNLMLPSLRPPPNLSSSCREGKVYKPYSSVMPQDTASNAATRGMADRQSKNMFSSVKLPSANSDQKSSPPNKLNNASYKEPFQNYSNVVYADKPSSFPNKKHWKDDSTNDMDGPKENIDSHQEVLIPRRCESLDKEGSTTSLVLDVYEDLSFSSQNEQYTGLEDKMSFTSFELLEPQTRNDVSSAFVTVSFQPEISECPKGRISPLKLDLQSYETEDEKGTMQRSVVVLQELEVQVVDYTEPLYETFYGDGEEAIRPDDPCKDSQCKIMPTISSDLSNGSGESNGPNKDGGNTVKTVCDVYELVLDKAAVREKQTQDDTLPITSVVNLYSSKETQSTGQEESKKTSKSAHNITPQDIIKPDKYSTSETTKLNKRKAEDSDGQHEEGKMINSSNAESRKKQKRHAKLKLPDNSSSSSEPSLSSREKVKVTSEKSISARRLSPKLETSSGSAGRRTENSKKSVTNSRMLQGKNLDIQSKLSKHLEGAESTAGRLEIPVHHCFHDDSSDPSGCQGAKLIKGKDNSLHAVTQSGKPGVGEKQTLGMHSLLDADRASGDQDSILNLPYTQVTSSEDVLNPAYQNISKDPPLSSPDCKIDDLLSCYKEQLNGGQVDPYLVCKSQAVHLTKPQTQHHITSRSDLPILKVHVHAPFSRVRETSNACHEDMNTGNSHTLMAAFLRCPNTTEEAFGESHEEAIQSEGVENSKSVLQMENRQGGDGQFITRQMASAMSTEQLAHLIKDTKSACNSPLSCNPTHLLDVSGLGKNVFNDQTLLYAAVMTSENADYQAFEMLPSEVKTHARSVFHTTEDQPACVSAHITHAISTVHTSDFARNSEGAGVRTLSNTAAAGQAHLYAAETTVEHTNYSAFDMLPSEVKTHARSVYHTPEDQPACVSAHITHAVGTVHTSDFAHNLENVGVQKLRDNSTAGQAHLYAAETTVEHTNYSAFDMLPSVAQAHSSSATICSHHLPLCAFAHAAHAVSSAMPACDFTHGSEDTSVQEVWKNLPSEQTFYAAATSIEPITCSMFTLEPQAKCVIAHAQEEQSVCASTCITHAVPTMVHTSKHFSSLTTCTSSGSPQQAEQDGQVQKGEETMHFVKIVTCDDGSANQIGGTQAHHPNVHDGNDEGQSGLEGKVKTTEFPVKVNIVRSRDSSPGTVSPVAGNFEGSEFEISKGIADITSQDAGVKTAEEDSEMCFGDFQAETLENGTSQQKDSKPESFEQPNILKAGLSEAEYVRRENVQDEAKTKDAKKIVGSPDNVGMTGVLVMVDGIGGGDVPMDNKDFHCNSALSVVTINFNVSEQDSKSSQPAQTLVIGNSSPTPTATVEEADLLHLTLKQTEFLEGLDSSEMLPSLTDFSAQTNQSHMQTTDFLPPIYEDDLAIARDNFAVVDDAIEKMLLHGTVRSNNTADDLAPSSNDQKVLGSACCAETNFASSSSLPSYGKADGTSSCSLEHSSSLASLRAATASFSFGQVEEDINQAAGENGVASDSAIGSQGGIDTSSYHSQVPMICANDFSSSESGQEGAAPASEVGTCNTTISSQGSAASSMDLINSRNEDLVYSYRLSFNQDAVYTASAIPIPLNTTNNFHSNRILQGRSSLQLSPLISETNAVAASPLCNFSDFGAEINNSILPPITLLAQQIVRNAYHQTAISNITASENGRNKESCNPAADKEEQKSPVLTDISAYHKVRNQPPLPNDVNTENNQGDREGTAAKGGQVTDTGSLSKQGTKLAHWNAETVTAGCLQPTGKTRQLPQHKDIDDEEEERVPENSIYEVPGGEEEEEAEAYQDNPSNRPLFEPPPDALYQVEATHAYYGEDEDELSFEAGDIIYVIPFENEDEQDEGWQMGVRQKDGIKGVFPENFTRQL